ncbi:MAG: MerR family transcriptional regulator [Anaerolineae bacterium]|nr:MerR family transcriptional regulator [Anaerolineae bacterium]
MSTSNQLPTYNLKAVVQETGLKPDTLRAWERRYGLPQPHRTPGGHRLYSQHDIDMLKWLAARQDEGLSISRAVDLWHSLQQEGTDPLQASTPEASLSVPPPPSFAVGSAITELRRAWIAACLAFDERTAESILAQASALYPLETVCFELLQKGLTQMGEGWYQGEVTVQQEHFASALAMRRLDALIAATPPPTRPSRILVACPPEEEHAFSPLLITLLLRRHGWDVVYLGADVPSTRLEFTIATARPQLVIVAAQQLHTAASMLEIAHLLNQERVPLAYGGAVFNHLPALRSRIPGHFLGEHLETTPQVVEQLLMSPRLGWPPPVVSQPGEACQEALAHYREHQALIEAHVWQLMKDEPIPHSRLANANIKFARNIIAALLLGNIDFLGADIIWIEGLFINHQMPTEQLRRYLNAYRQAVQTHLDERGKIIRDWLAQLLLEDIKNLS